MALWILQVAVSLFFFAQKVFVLAGLKRIGWLVGTVANVLGLCYFYLLGLYVYTTLDFGLFVLMGYGFLAKAGKNQKVEDAIRGVTAVVMLLLVMFVWSGTLTIVEFSSSFGLLAGTYYLVHEKSKVGWVLYVVGHIFGVYLGFAKHQQIFADFQVASAIVALAGAMRNK